MQLLEDNILRVEAEFWSLIILSLVSWQFIDKIFSINIVIHKIQLLVASNTMFMICLLFDLERISKLYR